MKCWAAGKIPALGVGLAVTGGISLPFTSPGSLRVVLRLWDEKQLPMREWCMEGTWLSRRKPDCNACHARGTPSRRSTAKPKCGMPARVLWRQSALNQAMLCKIVAVVVRMASPSHYTYYPSLKLWPFQCITGTCKLVFWTLFSESSFLICRRCACPGWKGCKSQITRLQGRYYRTRRSDMCQTGMDYRWQSWTWSLTLDVFNSTY